MKQCIVNIVIATAFLAVVQPISAQEQHTDTLDAHVHGVSELMIVAEGSELEIQFKSPAINLIGFEHKARTPKDILMVEQVASTLRQHDAVFLMSGANCRQTNTSEDLAKIMDTDHHDDGHKNSSSEGKHVHHEEHEHHEKHDNNHSEITATHNYHCKDSDALPTITVGLFELFAGIHEIKTMWVNQTRQGAVTLKPNNRTINF